MSLAVGAGGRLLRALRRVAGQRAGGSGPGSGLLQRLALRIRTAGPLSVAQYMREALTHPAQVCVCVCPRACACYVCTPK